MNANAGGLLHTRAGGELHRSFLPQSAEGYRIRQTRWPRFRWRGPARPGRQVTMTFIHEQHNLAVEESRGKVRQVADGEDLSRITF